jgi:hypothetical protein
VSGWADRIRPVAGPRGLELLRDAAHDLADHAGRPPGPGGTPFQTVYNVALLATVTLSGTPAGVHLWKTLFPKQPADRPASNARHRHEASGREFPPRHRSP